MKRILTLLLIVAVLAVVALGCTPAPATTTPTPSVAVTSPDPTKTETPAQKEKTAIGCFFPLSGIYASYGNLNLDGFRAYEAAFYEELGGFQIHPNRELEIMYFDHETNADVCMALFERYAPEIDVAAISISTMSTIACLPLAIKYEIPIFTTGITADRALHDDNDYIFRVASGDAVNTAMAKVFLEWLQDFQGKPFSTYAILCTSDDAGLAVRDTFGAKIEELGAVAVMEPEVVQYGQTTDVSGAISKIKAANPEVILCSAPALEAGMFQKALKQFKVEIPVITTGSGYADPAFFTAVGPGGADGVVSWQTWIYDTYKYSPDPDKTLYWIDKSEEINNRGFTEQTVHGWMVAGVIIDILDRAETLSGKDILAAVNATDIPPEHMFNWFSLINGCKFDFYNGSYNQNIHAFPMFGQIQNDTYVTIFLPGRDVIPDDQNPLVWPVKPYK